MTKIKEFQGEHRWLSNFVPVTIILRNIQFPSVEHAYMASKAPNDKQWQSLCIDSNNTAGTIKKASRKVKLVTNWENIKLQVMESCLKQKFNQEPYLSKLLATGNTILEEGNNWGDEFWGINLKNGKGQNHLGKLIMKIRGELQNV
jgi:ribA/ribD-fused uncharacterized protein